LKFITPDPLVFPNEPLAVAYIGHAGEHARQRLDVDLVNEEIDLFD
jgi:hypothetical protein